MTVRPLLLGLLVAALGGSRRAASRQRSGPTVPSTKRLPGTQCSVSVTFTRAQSARTMSYGGWIRCTGSATMKTLDVVPRSS